MLASYVKGEKVVFSEKSGEIYIFSRKKSGKIYAFCLKSGKFLPKTLLWLNVKNGKRTRELAIRWGYHISATMSYLLGDFTEEIKGNQLRKRRLPYLVSISYYLCYCDFNLKSSLRENCVFLQARCHFT